MEQIRFTIDGQHIQREASNNFKVVQLSKNYLRAKFDFRTEDWDGVTATALFRRGSRTWDALISPEGTCLVPWEALVQEGEMYVSVFGGSLITTDEELVRVAHSGYTTDIAEHLQPTQSVYELLTQYMDEALAKVEASVATVQDFIDNMDEIDGGNFDLDDGAEDGEEESDG